MITPEHAAQVFAEALNRGLIEAHDTAAVFTDCEELQRRTDIVQRAFPAPMLNAAAIKTNPQLEVLKFLVQRGLGLEAASFEELLLAERAGAPPAGLVFDSPVKTLAEIAACLERWPQMVINANTIAELARYPRPAPVRLGLRINPLSDPDVSALYNVSRPDSKFGVPITAREAIFEQCLGVHSSISGLHVHSGSSVSDMTGHARAIARVVALAEAINHEALRRDGTRPLRWIDIGGGIDYRVGEAGMCELRAELDRLAPVLFERYEVVTEFGQWLHATAGWVVTRVEYVEPSTSCADLAFVHVGADLFVRDIYAAPRDYRYVVLDEQGRQKAGPKRPVDLAGPLCFAGDVLNRGLLLPAIEPGDYLVILDSGANTLGLWSRHCSRTIPKCFGYLGRDLRLWSERTPIPF